MPRTKKITKEAPRVEEKTENETNDQNEQVELNFSRNEKGLVEGIQYVFCPETGLINWRKMVEKEYLVPNTVKFPDGTDFKSLNIDDLDDNQLLILLGGIKNLAQLRGYEKVEYKVHTASQNYVAVTCGITWLPNFETEGKTVYFEALADAHFENTKSFARDFLIAVAENRAFTRAVRNFLRINIVGSDEMGDSKKGASSIASEEAASKAVSSYDPCSLLSDLMKKNGITLDIIKSKLKEEGNEDAEGWNDVKEIPKDVVLKLIDRIKKKIKNK